MNEGNWKESMMNYLKTKEILKKKKEEEKMIDEKNVKIKEGENEIEIEIEEKKEDKESNNIENNDDEDIQENNEGKLMNEEKKAKNKKEKKSKKIKKKIKVTKKGNQSNKKKQNNENSNSKEIDFDELEFPIPYLNKKLSEDWFDFNDSAVTPIPLNRLQKQFGGSSENAYILIYRKKKLDKEIKKVPVPHYLMKFIDFHNELNINERNAYKIAENTIEIFFIEFSQISVHIFIHFFYLEL